MLDFDLAELYGVETAQLKRSVKRNMARFEGDDFMFEVTLFLHSRCQFGFLNGGRGRKYVLLSVSASCQRVPSSYSFSINHSLEKSCRVIIPTQVRHYFDDIAFFIWLISRVWVDTLEFYNFRTLEFF